MKFLKLLIATASLAFGSVAYAATVLPPLTIDFAYAGFNGGDFTELEGEVSGSITLDQIVIGGGNGVSTGEYVLTNGQLTFNTAAPSTEITITGGIGDLDIVDGTQLFTGSFVDFSYTGGVIEVFQGSGSGAASTGFLEAIGEADANGLAFYGFTMQRDISEGVAITSTDFLTTETGARTTVVPIPAAAWLFGTGLIGLVGVARRKV